MGNNELRQNFRSIMGRIREAGSVATRDEIAVVRATPIGMKVKRERIINSTKSAHYLCKEKRAPETKMRQFLETKMEHMRQIEDRQNATRLA